MCAIIIMKFWFIFNYVGHIAISIKTFDNIYILQKFSVYL